MTDARPAVDPDDGSVAAVLRNRPFLLLWLSQVATQVGGNMVLFGLTVIVFDATNQSTAAVALLLLTFLVPAVLFSAVAGVYVDRLDRRLILVVTNVLRFGLFIILFLVGPNVPLIYLINIAVSTITVFFAPAEAALIPTLVPRSQLTVANGLFTFTLNAAFAIGFALVGPLVVKLASAEVLLLVVGGLYLVAALFCFTLPASPAPEVEGRRSALQAAADAEKAIESTLAQLREGLSYIRAHRNVTWSLIYLGITASLIGVLGVLGPEFATDALGLASDDFVVVVLPLAMGIVVGVLGLNSYGRYLPRRRVIEGGLISLGVLLALLSIAGPIARFLQAAEAQSPLLDLSSLVSLLAVVVGIAFLAGVAYAVVAIPAQTQLQEDLPEDVRGRVFGVLNMLVSVASFLPIIIVGTIADAVGTPAVILAVAALVLASGLASVLTRGPLGPAESASRARAELHPAPVGPVDPVAVAMQSDIRLTRPEAEPRAPRDERG